MTHTPRWINTTTTAAILGIAPSTLREWVAEGRIRAWRSVGGRYLFSRTEVLRLQPRPVHRPEVARATSEEARG